MNEHDKIRALANTMGIAVYPHENCKDCDEFGYDWHTEGDTEYNPYKGGTLGLAQFADILLKFPEVMSLFRELPRRFDMDLEDKIKELEKAVAELKRAAGQRDEPEGYNWELAAKLRALVCSYSGKTFVLCDNDNLDLATIWPSGLAGHIRVHDGDKESPVDEDATVAVQYGGVEWIVQLSGCVVWRSVVAFVELPEVEV